MKRFRYAFDPLCLTACVLYALNRFWWRHVSAQPFFRNHFDDLLLIPCALPPVLWLQRRLGLRAGDGYPDLRETGFHLLVWTLIAEVLGPLVVPWAVADVGDALAYLIGAVIALVWWRTRETAQMATA